MTLDDVGRLLLDADSDPSPWTMAGSEAEPLEKLLRKRYPYVPYCKARSRLKSEICERLNITRDEVGRLDVRQAVELFAGEPVEAERTGFWRDGGWNLWFTFESKTHRAFGSLGREKINLINELLLRPNCYISVKPDYRCENAETQGNWRQAVRKAFVAIPFGARLSFKRPDGQLMAMLEVDERPWERKSPKKRQACTKVKA